MKAYYILGHNVAWLNGICLILFVIGVVGALAMVAIPEKFNLRVNRGDTFIYCALIAVVGFSGMFVISIHSFSMDELEAGRHWKDDCRTLEVNMPTGAFTSPVNKLDCDGIIINVPGLMAIAAAIAWSRVYLGVHWPLDMVGGLLAGMCGCLGAALIWHTFGPALYHQLQRLYRLCFSLPIRKGWVRG